MWQRASDVPVASAGTHPADAINAGTWGVAARRGITLEGRAPQSLSDVAAQGDLLVAVCDLAHEELAGADRLHWSIPDPVRLGTDAAFDAAFDDITSRIALIAPKISAPKG